MQIIIREEIQNDFLGIDEVNIKAFKQKTEATLIRKLRVKKDFIRGLSIVALDANMIVGYILFTPIKIKNQNSHWTSLALAPMAVSPDYQKKGIGKKLIEYGLKKAKELDFNSVIVLGQKDYYSQFGFMKASKWNIKCQFDVPDDAFMILSLKENSLENITGTVEYPEEFFGF